MILRSTALALVWLAAAPQVEAQDLGRARPESVGLSSSGLAKATAALRAHVESGDIAGVVAAVARRGKVVYFESLGQRDLASRDEMPADGIFRLYSMTRPITSTAVMLLWEEGKFKLDDPISTYLPQFRDQRVFVDADGPDLSQTRARVGEITVRHLLTHTSGIGSRSSESTERSGSASDQLRCRRWSTTPRGFRCSRTLAPAFDTGSPLRCSGA